MGIDHTEITKNRREVTISDGKEKVEVVTENVEVISVAEAELRKVEEVAAAQAQAISGRRGEEPASAQEEPGTAAEEETAPQPDEETAFREIMPHTISTTLTLRQSTYGQELLTIWTTMLALGVITM